MSTRLPQQPGLVTSFSTSDEVTNPTAPANSANCESHTLNGDADLIKTEFYRLLKESEFVARVIAIHRNNSKRTPVGWQNIVEENLPAWLFCLTDILTTQAALAAEERPMSRGQLAAQINDRLLREATVELRLKPYRKRIWTAAVLRITVYEALKYIDRPATVTLENVAKMMNRHFASSLPADVKRPLSTKHLQKLLRQNGIDWLELKRRYKERLLTRFMKRQV